MVCMLQDFEVSCETSTAVVHYRAMHCSEVLPNCSRTSENVVGRNYRAVVGIGHYCKLEVLNKDNSVWNSRKQYLARRNMAYFHTEVSTDNSVSGLRKLEVVCCTNYVA